LKVKYFGAGGQIETQYPVYVGKVEHSGTDAHAFGGVQPGDEFWLKHFAFERVEGDVAVAIAGRRIEARAEVTHK
jgi:hypothetical protein